MYFTLLNLKAHHLNLFHHYYYHFNQFIDFLLLINIAIMNYWILIL
jgi:hypothetical protein